MSKCRILLGCLVAATLMLAACQHEPKCTLTLANAPALIGLRLGMTTDEVRIKLPGLRLVPLSGGESVARLLDVNTQVHVIGVDNAELRFVDEKLYSLEVNYNDSGNWSGNEFIRDAQEKLALKPEWIKQLDLSGNIWGCHCNGFEIAITNPYVARTSLGYKPQPPTIKIEDLAGADRARSLGDVERKKQQNSFNP